MTAEARCALYRHFDATGVLLYVGISETLVTRGNSHARHSTWAGYAARAEAQWLDNRVLALRAEATAIRTEHPIFNKQHNDTVEARTRRATYLAARRAGLEFEPAPETELHVLSFYDRHGRSKAGFTARAALAVFEGCASAFFMAYQLFRINAQFGDTSTVSSVYALLAPAMAVAFTVVLALETGISVRMKIALWGTGGGAAVWFVMWNAAYFRAVGSPKPWTAAIFLALICATGLAFLAERINTAAMNERLSLAVRPSRPATA